MSSAASITFGPCRPGDTVRWLRRIAVCHPSKVSTKTPGDGGGVWAVRGRTAPISTSLPSPAVRSSGRSPSCREPSPIVADMGQPAQLRAGRGVAPAAERLRSSTMIRSAKSRQEHLNAIWIVFSGSNRAPSRRGAGFGSTPHRVQSHEAPYHDESGYTA